MLLKKIKYLSLTALLSLTLISSSVYAKSCAEGYACTEVMDGNTKKTLYIENLKTCEITATFNFTKLENMKTSKPTIPPLKKVKVMDISQKDKRKKWEYYYHYDVVDGTTNANHDNSYAYSLPYHSGESHKIIQGFNGSFSHKGEQRYSIDFDFSEGTDVLASRDGEVVATKSDSSEGAPKKEYGNKANYVYIKHSDGTFGAYLHLKKDGVLVSVGQRVRVGDVIGLSGNTGFSSGPHLHFWVFKANNGAERESFPIQFKTTDGIKTLLQSKRYTAP